MRDEKTLRGHVDAFNEPMSPGPDEGLGMKLWVGIRESI